MAILRELAAAQRDLRSIFSGHNLKFTGVQKGSIKFRFTLPHDAQVFDSLAVEGRIREFVKDLCSCEAFSQLTKREDVQLEFLCKAKVNGVAGGCIIIIIDRFYIALLSAIEQTHCARMLLFLKISTEVVYLQRWHGWCHKKLLPSRRVLSTPYNHAPCHFMQSHIHKVYVCLAVTCHLHFWQNDRGLLRATAVIRGWNGYRNKSQHRKSTLEKKILPPLLQGFEPTTFRSRVRRSNH